MKNSSILTIAVIISVALTFTGFGWIQAAEMQSSNGSEVTEDKAIPEKPGGIPHPLDGSYTQCSTCHQLEIPPHPEKVESCLICHTQKVEETKDD